MALEPIPGNPEDFMPEDLVVANPEGTDSIDYGDNHIRLIKLALKNLDREVLGALGKLLNLFDDEGRVKLALKAKEAERLSSKFDLSHFALQDGDYENLRARGTTRGDVGLHRLLNMPLSEGFTPAGMSSEEYLSLGSALAFQSQILKEVDEKLSSDEDLSGYAKTDGDYERLRAMRTEKDDIGLGRFNGQATASKAWYEIYGAQSVSPYALVTAAYIATILGEDNFPTARPQTEYMHLDSWSGFSKEYHDEYVNDTFKSVTCWNGDNIPLAYSYWLTCPEFKVEAVNRTGKDVPLQIMLWNVTLWKGIVKADSTVETLVTYGVASIRRQHFDPSDRNHVRDMRVAGGKFTGNLTITYATGTGVYTLWHSQNIGAQ